MKLSLNKMNFQIQTNDTIEEGIVSPCQLLHTFIAHDHNTFFKIYIKCNQGISTDILQNYYHIKKNGISCEFEINNHNIVLTYYSVPIHFHTNKLNAMSTHYSFIRASMYDQTINAAIMHKIYIGEESNDKKVQTPNLQAYNIIKNFYYIYLNAQAIQSLCPINKICQHNIMKESFYNAGCICIFCDKTSLLKTKEDNAINFIKFIAKIIQLKIDYYNKSTTNIKIIIDKDITEYIYKCIKTNITQVQDIVNIINDIIKIQEQYIYSECKQDNLNFSLLEMLIDKINQCYNTKHVKHDKLTTCILLLASFINSKEFQSLHMYYQKAILYIIQESEISEFFIKNELDNETCKILFKKINQKKQNKVKKAEVFVYITTGSIEILNIQEYDMFDIFQFLKNTNNTDIFSNIE